MKNGWQLKKLNEVCIVERGSSPRPIKQYFTTKPDGVNWIKIGDTEEGGKYVFSTAQKITPEGAKQSRFVKEGDFILTNSMSFGRPYIMKTSGYIHDGWFVLRLKEFIDADYFYHLLSSEVVQSQFRQLANGAIVQNISGDLVKMANLPIPPLPEQQRIVGLLDEAFAGIATAKANAEKNLQNARALFESHLQSIFTQCGKGWMKNNLKALTTKIGSGATPRGGEESYKTEGISLIRSLNVHDLSFKYRKLAFLDDAQANELSNVEVQPRDVLLNITGASVARCCIVPEDVLPARVNQHVSIIRPIAEKLDADFLHYLLISKPYKDQLLQTGEEGGSTRQAITKAQIQDFTVEFPKDLKEQKSIVTKLDAMLAETERLASIYERKLATLEAFKKSLLHQTFTGNL